MGETQNRNDSAEHHHPPLITLTRAEWPDLVPRVKEVAAALLDRLSEPIAPSLPSGPGENLPAARVEQVIRQTLTRQIPTLLETILATERILDELTPRALVVGNDLTLEGRAAVLTARRSGTPTLSLMHGTVTSDPLQKHHVVDRFLVYGDRSREELLSAGLAPQRVVVTGNPQLSSRPEPSRTTDPRVVELAGIPPGSPWILVASSGPGHRTSWTHHQAFVRALEELAHALPEIRFVVKLHRKDRRSSYPTSPPFAIIDHGTEGAPSTIFSWLRGPIALITGASTVAIEAMLMSVPVVTVDLLDELSNVDFIRAGATQHARTSQELHGIVERLVHQTQPAESSEGIEPFLRSTFASLDGGAARRAARSILETGQSVQGLGA